MSEIDLGLLIVRLALGPMLFAHGWNKAFGAGGISGTESWFAGLGLRPAWLHARLAAGSEMAAGVLLAIGFLSPFACFMFIALMGVATVVDHVGKGYFVFKGVGSTPCWLPA